MKRFNCPMCGLRVFFEDRTCTRCGHGLIYDPAADDFVLNGTHCAHRDTDLACNWGVAGSDWCAACQLVDLGEAVAPSAAAPYHAAIRRALRQLKTSGVHPENLSPPLRFLLRNGSVADVTIGHADGEITLDTAESDPAHREATRTMLNEQYRTVLGHVRHELGHWHWQAIVEPDPDLLQRFTHLFGDHTADYQAALKAHYAADPEDTDWRAEYLSYYASAHPWEDYAESFAHALHMTDTLQTCRAVGFTAVTGRTPDQILAVWDDVSVSMNELNRAMGTPDPYPFAPSPAAQVKLGMLLDVLVPH